MTRPDPKAKYLSKADFAAYFNISVPTVHRLIANCAVIALKIGGSVRIPVSEVARYEAQLAAQPRLEFTTRAQEREKAAAAQRNGSAAVVDPALAPFDLDPSAPVYDLDEEGYPSLTPRKPEPDPFDDDEGWA